MFGSRVASQVRCWCCRAATATFVGMSVLGWLRPLLGLIGELMLWLRSGLRVWGMGVWMLQLPSVCLWGWGKTLSIRCSQ